MMTMYYVVGDKVYCKGKGDKGKAQALKKVVECLEDAERASFKFAGGWWVLVKGSEGWLCAFSPKRNAPDALRLQMLAILNRLEKEVDGEWQLL